MQHCGIKYDMLGSAKPGHIELSDQSDVKIKRLMMVIKANGASIEFRLD